MIEVSEKNYEMISYLAVGLVVLAFIGFLIAHWAERWFNREVMTYDEVNEASPGAFMKNDRLP